MTPEQYVEEALMAYARDGADTPYQEGFRDALIVVWKEAFGREIVSLGLRQRRRKPLLKLVPFSTE